eukprot:Nk52_evm2s348 gene=Nk52_evmTU2s348
MSVAECRGRERVICPRGGALWISVVALLTAVQLIQLPLGSLAAEGAGGALDKEGFSKAIRKNLQDFCPMLMKNREEQAKLDSLTNLVPCGLSRVLLFRPMSCKDEGKATCVSCNPHFTPLPLQKTTPAKDAKGAKGKGGPGEEGGAGGGAGTGGGGAEGGYRRRRGDLDTLRDESMAEEEEYQGSLVRSGRLYRRMDQGGEDPNDPNAAKKKKEPEDPYKDASPCYVTTVGTNMHNENGIKRHIGFCQQLQEMFVFYLLFKDRVGINTEELLSAPNRAGVLTVDRVKNYLKGYYDNLQQESLTPTREDVYLALLFAFSYVGSSTWTDAGGDIRMNANFRNTASFPTVSQGRSTSDGKPITVTLPYHNSLITAFYYHYVKDLKFNGDQQNLWQTWNTEMIEIKRPVNVEANIALIVDQVRPMSDAKIKGLIIEVCPLLSCLLTEFMKGIHGQFQFMATKEELSKKLKTKNIFSRMSYTQIGFRFVMVDKKNMVSAWNHYVTVVIEPDRICWFDANTALYVYNSDSEISAFEKLYLALQDDSRIKEPFLKENNPLYPYFHPKIWTQIAAWSKQSRAVFTLDEAVKLAGTPKENDHRLFLLPGVDIYNSTGEFDSKVRAWLDKNVGSNVVDINEFFRRVAKHLRSPETDLFTYIDQPTYAMRAFALNPEVFGEKAPQSSSSEAASTPAAAGAGGSSGGTPPNAQASGGGESPGDKEGYKRKRRRRADEGASPADPSSEKDTGATSPGADPSAEKDTGAASPGPDPSAIAAKKVPAGSAASRELVTEGAVPIMNDIFGLSYEENILGSMKESDEKVALRELLAKYRTAIFATFDTASFSNGTTSGLLDTVLSMRNFIATGSKFYTQILKTKCGFYLDMRNETEIPRYPKLNDAQKFTNLLYSIPQKVLQVRNFFSPAGVQFLSVITSAIAMKDITKLTTSKAFYDGMPAEAMNWGAKSLVSMARRYSQALKEVGPYLDKTFGLDQEVYRSQNINNFQNYFKAFGENLKQETLFMSKCLNSTILEDDSNSAQAVFLWYKTWHDVFFVSTGVVSYYTRPVVEGAFRAVAYVFNSPIESRRNFLNKQFNLPVSRSIDAAAFTAWFEQTLYCPSSKQLLEKQLEVVNNKSGKKYLVSVDTMFTEMQGFAGSILNLVFARGTTKNSQLVGYVEGLDKLFVKLAKDVLSDIDYVEKTANLRFPAVLKGKSTKIPKIPQNALPYLFPNFKNVMTKYRQMALMESNAITFEILPWSDLMSSPMQKLLSILTSAALQYNAVTKGTSDITDIALEKVQAFKPKDLIFQRQKVKAATIMYINALMQEEQLIKTLPSHTSDPEISELLIQVNLLSRNARSIYDKLAANHKLYKSEAIDPTGAKMEGLFFFAKYLYDGFSFAYCTAQRLLNKNI